MQFVPAELELWRPARPVDINEPIQGYVILMGFAIKESTGTAGAEFDMYNGQDTRGLLFLPVSLAANESTSEWYGPQGLDLPGGLFLNVSSGQIKGSVWIHDRLGSNR